MHVTMELDGIPVAIWGDAACFEDGREFLEGWVNLDLGELAPIARKAKTIQYRTALPDEIAIWERDEHDLDDEHLTFLPGARIWRDSKLD